MAGRGQARVVGRLDQCLDWGECSMSSYTPTWVEGRGWMLWNGHAWLRWDGAAWHEDSRPEAEGPTSSPTMRLEPAPGVRLETPPYVARVAVPPADAWPVPMQPQRADGFTQPSVVGLVGGLAVALGAFLPFINQSIDDTLTGDAAGYMRPDALHTSSIFGMIAVAVAACGYWAAVRIAIGIITIVLGALGSLGYAIFMIAGFIGVDDEQLLGAHLAWTPNIGLLLSITGCLVYLASGIALLRRRSRR